ncbi:MAG: YidC/Oxa1 family membrane protein insertase [Oscillochloris sp.]|nr:YidC/Oxa1 family membrane protein insertase [Oscillochloris sp.]
MGAIWSGFVGFLEQALLWFSTVTGSVALGIVLFTVCARLVILPLTLTSLRSSRRMQEIQPLIKELQRKYGKEPQRLQEETLKIYREQKINPLGGCLPLLLQLPIFFGVYQAVYHLMVPEQRINLSADAAAALQNPEIAAMFNEQLFGFIDLGTATFGAAGFAGIAYVILPLLSILLQFLQQLMATPRVQDPQQKAMMQAMMFMPFIFGYIAFTFPTGAVLYWVVSSLVGVVQQYFTSGWGSLANYLKFLPPDGRITTASALSPAVVGATAGGAEAAAPAPKTDFWSVMRPLTETTLSNAPQTVESEGVTDVDAVESAMKEARSQGRAQANLRRPRRRR